MVDLLFADLGGGTPGLTGARIGDPGDITIGEQPLVRLAVNAEGSAEGLQIVAAAEKTGGLGLGQHKEGAQAQSQSN